MKKSLLLLALLVFVTGLSANPAKYVWDTPTGEGEGQYVYFRNEVELSERPSKAEINLYAFSRYALIVNGEYINFGPIRSTKERPFYDTYDILPNLKAGTNIITVEAYNNGMHTFQLPYGTAAFIAWGEIVAGGKNVDLATPGNWLCRAAKGYNPNVQRFSFAKGPIEIFDARKEPDNWRAVDIIASEWKKPVVMKDQSAFGELEPRSIPPLTQEERTPAKCVIMTKKEYFGDLYNFEIVGKSPTKTHYDFGGKDSVQIYTYIYSPENQVIKAALSWGEYWINGKKIEQEDLGTPFQKIGTIPLTSGWNLLFGDMELVFGATEFMMILPKGKDLVVSADLASKDPAKGIAITGPNKGRLITDQESFKPAKKDKNWFFVPAQTPSTNPAKAVFLMNERRMMLPDPLKMSNIKLTSDLLNNVLFDMGEMLLGRIFVEVEAPVGAIIDITFSETEKDGYMDLYRMINVNAGLRYISKGGKQRFESFRPYGLRYLQVTVTNDSEPVFLDKVGVISQIYPFEKLGSFQCSDPMLNSIWELGWRTLRVCSEDSYTDTPFRERGHYAGDMYPEYAISLVTSGDSRLAKHTIRVFMQNSKEAYLGDGSNMGNDFTAINLLVAAWYIRMTNDQEFAEEIYPYFKNYLQRWYENRTPKGYYHPKGDTFFEWLPIDKTAALTQFQTFIYRLYQEMAYLAERVNDTEQIRIAYNRANETKKMINEVFWGGSANGVFFDGIDKNGKYLTSRFPNSSLIPMAYDITQNGQDELIMRNVEFDLLGIPSPFEKENITRTTSYGGFYALAGLYAKGNAKLAEEYMIKRWSPMIYTGNDTAWEDFDYSNGTWTLSHAWSCGPTYFLSTETLGVKLGYPELFDSETITIAPQSEKLTWAKGTVPHPKGLVSVSWRVAGNNLYLDYTAPEGTPVKVEPKGRLAEYNLIINQTKK